MARRCALWITCSQNILTQRLPSTNSGHGLAFTQSFVTTPKTRDAGQIDCVALTHRASRTTQTLRPQTPGIS